MSACFAASSLSTLGSHSTLLKNKSSSAWSAAKSEEQYGFKRWGSGHISVDNDGFVNVQPLVDGRGIRVLDVVQEALEMGLKAPMVIRFQDLLRYRVTQLNEMFAKAISGITVYSAKVEVPMKWRSGSPSSERRVVPSGR